MEASLKQYDTASPSDADPAEVAKVSRKLENAKVKQAKESSANAPKN